MVVDFVLRYARDIVKRAAARYLLQILQVQFLSVLLFFLIFSHFYILLNFYFILLSNRSVSAAASARVALFCGLNVPSV